MSKIQPVLLPPEVSRLRLGSAFRGYAVPFQNCISITSDQRFLVVDDGVTQISNNPFDEYRTCVVINPSSKKIIVLSIDHKLIDQRPGGMADGAVFDNKKFAFVEFKDHSEGNLDYSIEKTYEKACNQLHQAVELFKELMANVSIEFLKMVKVECHIIVNKMFPEAKAIQQDKATEFAIDNPGLELSFEREIYFNS